MAQLEFVPRKQLAEKLREGFRLIAGHEYAPADYAILMQIDEAPEPITDFRINLLVGRFNPVQRRRSNKSAANSATNKQRWDNYRAKLARLENA